jgi:hypothetical protein
MKTYISLLLTFGLLLSCNDDAIDCSTVLCAGPPVFFFKILNNGEDVIENGSYSIESISISGTDEDSFILEIRTWQTSSEEITGVFINNESWMPQTYEMTLSLGTDFSIPIDIEIGLTEAESCCGGIAVVDGIVIDGEPQSLNDGTLFTIAVN